MAFLDHPDLVRIAPVPTTWRVLGGQDLDLGCERKVDHDVGLVIASSAPSDGPRRRVTLNPLFQYMLNSMIADGTGFREVQSA